MKKTKGVLFMKHRVVNGAKRFNAWVYGRLAHLLSQRPAIKER